MAKKKKDKEGTKGKKAMEAKKTEELTPEMAKALLRVERQARVQRCQKKIGQALAEENCVLDCSIVITAQGNIPQIQVRPAPETE